MTKMIYWILKKWMTNISEIDKLIISRIRLVANDFVGIITTNNTKTTKANKLIIAI